MAKIDDKYLLLSCVSNLFDEYYSNDSAFDVYHLLLENDDINKHCGIYANGVLSESISEDVFNNV